MDCGIYRQVSIETAINRQIVVLVGILYSLQSLVVRNPDSL